jgi:hypothetical protein
MRKGNTSKRQAVWRGLTNGLTVTPMAPGEIKYLFIFLLGGEKPSLTEQKSIRYKRSFKRNDSQVWVTWAYPM